LTLARAAFYSGRMTDELARLEQKVYALVALVEELREANADLVRDVAAAREQNRALAQRMQAASARLDALIARLPSDLVQP
jgi:chromosome segregation ATPase